MQFLDKSAPEIPLQSSYNMLYFEMNMRRGDFAFSHGRERGVFVSETDEFEIDLLRVCRALWKKAWAIVLCAGVFGACVFGYGKYTYIPMYAANTTMYISSTNEKQIAFVDSNGSIIQTSLGDARNLVATCGAMLKTRTVLEEVINAAGVNRTSAELLGMITTAAVDHTELFNVTVTSENPEEAAKVANSIAQVLPRKMALVNSSHTIGQLDSAMVPTNPAPSKISRNTAIAALVGAMLACAVIAASDIWQQYKEQDSRNVV